MIFHYKKNRLVINDETGFFYVNLSSQFVERNQQPLRPRQGVSLLFIWHSVFKVVVQTKLLQYEMFIYCSSSFGNFYRDRQMHKKRK